MIAGLNGWWLAQADAAALPSDLEVQSVWDFVVKGGPMMIPILACSLIALAIVVERTVSLRRSRVLPPDFLPGLEGKLDGTTGDTAQALAYCNGQESIVANIFGAGIKKLGAPLPILEKAIEEAGQRAVLRLRKFLRALSVIAAIAPLLGLLGTIFGMIKAFQTVALSAEALGKTEMLATGIYQALITTAAGLMVAIPTLIAYHWISARIERLVGEIDQMTVAFVERHGEARLPRPVGSGTDHEPRVQPAMAAAAT